MRRSKSTSYAVDVKPRSRAGIFCSQPCMLFKGDIGWISQGALNYICRRLMVPPAEAYGVVTFYSLLATEKRPARGARVCAGSAQA